MLKSYYADLHIHIGAGEDGRPVKITASRSLNFANILKEAHLRKGLDIVGIIDSASPVVLNDIKKLLQSGEMKELETGGIIYQDDLFVILGAEIESREENGGQVHYLAYFPYLKNIEAFSQEMSKHITNITLSSQTTFLNGSQILEITNKHNGILIPAHAFTPHKSFYGRAFTSYKEIFTNKEWDLIPAIELGLSADTWLADHLSELSNKSYLSNSDAHSLPKIAREYNELKLKRLNFNEFKMALSSENGRKIKQNFGLDPALGKYHRSYCERCELIMTVAKPVLTCQECGSDNIIRGVKDRVLSISDQETTNSPSFRSEYNYQIPLLDIPGIGKKTLDKMLKKCGTEMDILHNLSADELKDRLGAKLTEKILKVRNGSFMIKPGGGGKYGKVKF